MHDLASFNALRKARQEVEALDNEYEKIQTAGATSAGSANGNVVPFPTNATQELDDGKINEYAAALAGLSEKQREVLLSQATLTDSERAAVRQSLEATKAITDEGFALAAKNWGLMPILWRPNLTLMPRRNTRKRK